MPVVKSVRSVEGIFQDMLFPISGRSLLCATIKFVALVDESMGLVQDQLACVPMYLPLGATRGNNCFLPDCLRILPQFAPNTIKKKAFFSCFSEVEGEVCEACRFLYSGF